MEEELREGHLDVEAPALPSGPEPQSEAERDLMDELGRRVRQQSSLLKGNQELQEYVIYIGSFFFIIFSAPQTSTFLASKFISKSCIP